LFVHAADTLWLVYAAAFAKASIAQFSSPGFAASLPQVVGAARVVRANSLLSARENAARLLSPPLAGLLMVALSLAGVAVLDAAARAGGVLTASPRSPGAARPTTFHHALARQVSRPSLACFQVLRRR